MQNREYIDIRKYLEGILTNLIPQIIKAGEKIGTVIPEDGKEEPVSSQRRTLPYRSRNSCCGKMYARRGIIDERTTIQIRLEEGK